MSAVIAPTVGRYCSFCTRRLVLPYFALVLDANGNAVRVHKQCAEEARRFWHPPTAQERELVAPVVAA